MAVRTAVYPSIQHYIQDAPNPPPRQHTARQIPPIDSSLQSRGTAPCTTAAHDSAAVRPSAVAVIAGWHSERTAVSFAMAWASSADASWRSTTHPLSASLSTLNRQAEPTDRRPLVLAPFHPVSPSGSFSQQPRQPGQDMQADDQLTGLGPPSAGRPVDDARATPPCRTATPQCHRPGCARWHGSARLGCSCRSFLSSCSAQRCGRARRKPGRR